MSADVANEFISIKASGVSHCARMCPTCLAMKSRKVSPSLSGSSDFAFSRPMPVPSPPLSLSITVDPSSDGSSFVSDSYVGSESTAVIDDSGMKRLSPDVSFSKLYLKALIAASLRPSAFIFDS